jgi:uncharacterized protein (TIGR04562 family)
MDEATAFLRAYGYDPEVPAEARVLHAATIEAISFIERQLLLPREWNRGIRPPDEILFCEDPRHLLMWASGDTPSDRLRRAWACAVLRVMHTIAHIEGIGRWIDVNEARQQIFGRFRRYVHRDEQKRLWLGEGDRRVELANVEWKDGKTRNSIILKLLHKRDNVAETIYDFLGVRIVTRRLCDVMMIVKYLREFHIIVYPNAYPARARNNLIDLKRFRAQIETLRDMLTAGSISPTEIENMVARVTTPIPDRRATALNPHSAASYRSIQLTGRQIVKVRHHRYEWLDKMKAAAGKEGGGALAELAAFVEGWYSVQDGLDAAAFVPFEVQIMDAEAYEQVLSGDAAHDRYKLSQVRAARKRVLSRVLELSRQSPS